MILHDSLHAALAAERQKALVAQAAPYRLARQARRSPGPAAARVRWPRLRRLGGRLLSPSWGEVSQ